MRSRSFIFLTVFLACATSSIPRSNSRADLQRYVEAAADVVREQGPAACAALSGPRWMSGDYYVFVATVDDNTMVCHPARPDFVGQNQDELRDANGKYIARDMLAVVRGPAGSGWVDYVWPRPGQSNPLPKSAYVMAVTGADGKRYMVGSGGYEMSR